MLDDVINTMDDIRESSLNLVPLFNTCSDVLKLGMPYILRHKNGMTIIATMRAKGESSLTFESWGGEIIISAKDYHANREWTIYPAKPKENIANF